MAATVVDNVKINVLSSGTGALTLGTAVQGYRGVEALANGLTYNYAIRNGGAYEIGQGTFLSDGNILSRSVLYSSDGGTPVSLRPGTEVSFVALAADLNGTGLTSEAIAAANQAIAASADAQDLLAQIEAIAAPLAGVLTDDGASLVGTLSGLSVEAELAARVKTDDLAAPVDSLSTLAALNPVVDQSRYVTTGAARGQWECFAGSTPTDPFNILYKASNTAGYFWARVWDGIHGKPEWGGALRNSNNPGVGAANLTAINACIVLCPVTVFENADYWVNGKILSQTPYRALKGVPGDGYNTGNGTRIISTSLTNAVIRFGPDAQPATTPEFMRGIGCYGATFMHGGALTAPASLGDAATATATIERQWLFRPRFEDVTAWEPLIGFRNKGLIQAYSKNRKVLRTGAAAGGADFCWGDFLDGGVWASGLPGNPSYFDDELACEFSPSLVADKVGVLARGDFSDVFISKVETVNATSGVRFFASGTRAQINVHLMHCVFDQCAGTAVDIQSLAAGACVNIEGGYFQSKATATAVIHARGTNGIVNITGGAQILGNEAGVTMGVYAQGQRMLNIASTVSILECPRPVLVEGATNGEILCTAQNDVIGAGTQAAISINSTGKMRITPKVVGKANAFARGIELVGTAQSGHHIDPTLVLASCINGGAANKLVIDPYGTPVQITTPGYKTSAGGAGTSGAGLLVTGITA